MYIYNNNISIWEVPMSRNWVILPPLLSLGLNTLEKTITVFCQHLKQRSSHKLIAILVGERKGKTKGQCIHIGYTMGENAK